MSSAPLAAILCTAVAASPAAGGGARCSGALERVMAMGRDRGGMELAEVVDLNMRGWKPQSSHGIEILGWSAAPGATGRCVVSYAYRDGTPVVMRWDVHLASGTVTPLSPLARRMQRMTELLSRRPVAGVTAARRGSTAQANDVTTKRREP